MTSDEIRYRLFKLIQAQPDITQRQLAQELGVSLGKTHYCLKALIDKGWVKAARFRDNPNKGVYAYLLTPRGITEKARVTTRFLKRKIGKFKAIKVEIEELRSEVEDKVELS